MLLTSLTSSDEIRAVLGVSATDLPDRVLALSQYDLIVTLALEDIAEALPAAYEEIAALSSGSRSSTQQRLYDLCRLYASYALAKTLLVSLPMFAVASLTDGKAGFSRASDIYEDVRLGVEGMLNTLRVRLSNSYVGLYGGEPKATSTFDFVLSSTLGTDPVTTTAV